MWETARQLLESEFMPHGHCYFWYPELLWLHVTSDALIVAAYYVIPAALVYFVRRRPELPFRWLFYMFAGFIAACGTTHVMDIWTVWNPDYLLQGAIKLGCAVISVATAVVMIPLIPRALTLRGPAELEALNRALEAEVAERKRLEKRFRQLLETAPDAVVVVDRDGRIVLINSRTQALFGYAPEELHGQPVEVLVPEAARQWHVGYGEGFLQRPGLRPMGAGLDLYGRRKDGSGFPVEISLSTLETDEGLLVSAAIRDTTRRKRTEAALRESEERYRSLINDVLDASQVGILIMDARQQVVWASQALELYLGIPKEQLIGQDARMLIHTRVKTRFEDPDGFAARVLATYDNTACTEVLECHVLEDGERRERWLEYRSRPIRTGLYAGGRLEQYYDVSERRQAEEALFQAQKMEAVGQLTGGVAHDFNNLLTVVSGNLQMLEDRLRDDPALRRLVAAAAKASRRGAELTGKLLAYSRRQTLMPREIDLNDLVCGVTDWLRRTLGEHVEIETVLRDGLWRTLADPHQVETALLNLVLNARDAMPDGGTLTIETANVQLDDFALHSAGVTPGGYVMLAVSDTGCGMAPEVVRRAFEPFFTTKAPGKGSGLGLSMVYGFIKQSGGHIKIYSEAGYGSTVKLYLPRAVAGDRG
ncbi:MAG: PAS domain S-box protein, partial [Pseudomonadota bacterium]|nr:PAS domain S-box protein [Pseudomonadota bacterium]